MPRPIPESYMPDVGLSVTRPGKPPGDPSTWIQLSSNESSYGGSPLALAALQQRAQQLGRYPDSGSLELRQAIGRRYGLSENQVICGNGSESIIESIGRCYARPGDEILFSRYGFIQFRIFAERLGATAVTAPERDHTADVDALLAAVTPRTRILFLANPNNPTGTHVPAAELRRLRDRLPPEIVLVIDSAYAEFGDASDYTAGHELVEGTENVLVSRTFSKAFGLAALRVGWAHGPASMIRVLNRMKQIGNVNALAQAAAVAALEDIPFMERVVAATVATRARTARVLAGMGLRSLPSQGNFLCVEFPAEAGRTSADAYDYLLSRGIIVRRIEDYGLDRFLRIGIGTDPEMDKLMTELGIWTRKNI